MIASLFYERSDGARRSRYRLFDNFDKISVIHRFAIQEMMDKGHVTIANVKMNARCSVLAAADLVDGQYNHTKTPMANIGLHVGLY